MTTVYTVIYRMGGPERFEWQRTVAIETREIAERARTAVVRMGDAAHIIAHPLNVRPDLPTTFEFQLSPAMLYERARAVVHETWGKQLEQFTMAEYQEMVDTEHRFLINAWHATRSN